MQNIPQNSPRLLQDEEIDRLRALFARVDQPRPPKGIRKFFHDLAERSAHPPKRVIMERIREAS